MLKRLTSFIQNLIDNIRLKNVANWLRSYELTVDPIDFKNKSILFSLGENVVVLFNLDNTALGHRLEASLALDSVDLVTLKTISDLSNIAYRHTCSMSGLSGNIETGMRIAVCSPIDKEIKKKDLSIALTYLGKCVQDMDKYIQNRVDGLNSDSSLDLSMFEEIDLFLFDPQALGEKKHFVYGNWKTYSEALYNPEFVGFSETLTDVESCMKFEEANGLMLSDVGDMILREIIWNRRIVESAEDCNSIN